MRGAVCVTLIALAANVHANVRPWGSASSLSELQGVFDTIGSTIDVMDDQTPEALFEPTGTGNSVASYVATASWGFPELEFGIYNMDSPNQLLSLFYESDVAAGDSVVVQFNEFLDYVRVVDLNTLSVLGSTSYFKEFGFYALTTDHSQTEIGPFYSEDALNPGGYARMLTYEGKGDQVTIGNSGTYSDIDHWYVAVEADIYESTETGDFSDMVVQMESITPIPEPATLGLITLFTGGIYFVRRFFVI